MARSGPNWHKLLRKPEAQSCTALRYNESELDNAAEITVLQLPKFKAEATELIGTEGIEALAVYLADHPDAGDVSRLPDPLLCQERQERFECGREEATAADRGQSERSAINAEERR